MTPYGKVNQVATQITQPDMYLSWDALGRLAASQFPSGSNSATERYAYAASGLRVALTDDDNPTLNRVHAYGSDGLLWGLWLFAWELQ